MICSTIISRVIGGMFLLLLVPSFAMAQVKISMKNGMDIFAEECREESDRLVCYKMGGSFEIEKKDIRAVKNVSPGGEVMQDIRREDAASAGAKDQGKKGENNKQAVAKKEGTSASGTVSSVDKKAADADAQKMQALQSEREKLVKERQQLQEDIKKAPDWMSSKQYDELNKRNVELEDKIKKYNEDAGKLTEQDKKGAAEPKK